MWTPKEIRKLLILLTGVGLEIAGVILLIQQVQTTGSIDINSSLISGKIQSGSAGILICFIGLFVMALSIFSSKETIIHTSNAVVTNDSTQVTITSLKPDEKRGLVVIILVGLLTLGLIFSGIRLEKRGWEGASILIVFGVFCAIGEAFLLVSFIASYLDTDPKSDTEKQKAKD